MRRVVLLIAVLLCAATPAFGHVSVTPTDAAKGATAAFVFAVPNESETARTVKIEIVFPEDASFTTIEAMPKDGWINTATPRSVSWSGGALAGDANAEFSATLGPLPNTDTIVFKALQTYSDGSVVRWIGEPSTDNPAPVVRLTGAPVAVPTTTSTTSPTPPVTTPAAEDDDDSNGATVLIFGAMVLAGVGVGIAIGARRRSST